MDFYQGGIFLKATGIVRRIDDLGRVVIPKEIRKTLHIREGDPLEIFTDREGEIILKKYSPMGELGNLTKWYAESLYQASSNTICFVDKDVIISTAGNGKKDLLDRGISRDLEKLIQSRNPLTAKRGDANFVQITDAELSDIYNYEHISPVISDGDAVGAVVILSVDKKLTEVDEKLALAAAFFVSKQLD